MSDAPGDRAREFQALYEEHSSSVYLTALRVTGNPSDAEDVLQTVFLRVLDSQPSLDDSRAPGAYLRRAAANASIDLLRRKATRREGAIDDRRDTRRGGGPTELRVRADSRQEHPLLKARLRQAFATISPQNAKLFVLCYLEGYSYDELAELLELERGTVASRLHRIRAALRKELSR
jgi:RNA polymerase sigma-70 factor (ECF subfamily)